MPESFTEATLVSLLDHATVLFDAFSGSTVAVSVWLPPTFRLMAVSLSVMLVTGVPAVTVTWHSAYTPLPSVALQTIVQLPLAKADTVPA